MKPKLRELLLASFEFEDYNPMQTKILILNAMFFITIIINILFIFISLFISQTYVLRLVCLFIVVLIGYALYLLREKEKYDIASYKGIATLFSAFIMIIFLKHGDGYTLVWTYFFAPYAIITLGAKRGLMVSFTFVMVVLSITYAGIDIWNIETYLRFSLAHFVMLYVIYANQQPRPKGAGYDSDLNLLARRNSR